MKRSVALGLALATAAAVPAFAVEFNRPNHHHHVYHRHVYHHLTGVQPMTVATPQVPAGTPAPAPFPSLFPSIKPYPDGKGDEDGLSENVDDCNKGCIGGNPN